MARMGPKPGTIPQLKPHDIITDGGAVGVLLSNRSARVWVDRADYDRIVKAHGNRVWSWVEAARYVKLRIHQNASVPVARLVVGDHGHFIRYADGDRLNLKRINLSTEEPVRPGSGAKRKALKQGSPRAPSVKVREPSRPASAPTTAKASPTPPGFRSPRER